MAAPIDITYNAPYILVNYTNPLIGDCIVLDPAGAGYVLATDTAMAARANSVAEGVVIAVSDATISFVTFGRLSADSSGLGVGAKSLIKRGSTGRLVRAAFDTTSEFMGECDGDGNVVLSLAPSLLVSGLATLVSGGGDLDPRDFGCPWDNSSIRIKRCVEIIGRGGGTDQFFDGMEFAPGFGIFFDNYNTANDGGGTADYSKMSNVSIKSYLTLYPFSHGSYTSILATQGQGPKGINKQSSRNTYFRAGDAIIRYTVHNDLCFFRVLVKGVSGGCSEPAEYASTIAGVKFTDGQCTMVSEMFPVEYASSPFAMRVGDRVMKTGDTNHLFECTVAGTTAGVPSVFNGPVYFAGAPQATPETIADGTVTWTTKSYSAIVTMSNRCTFKDLVIQGFLNCAYYFHSTTRQVPAGNSDFNKVIGGNVSYCGTGVRVRGSDSNGCNVCFIDGTHNGLGRATLDATYGAGGNLIYDTSSRNCFIGCYAQGGHGPAYRTSNTGQSIYINCSSENASYPDVFDTTSDWLVTVLNSSNVGLVTDRAIASYVRGIPNDNGIYTNSKHYEVKKTTTTSTVNQSLLDCHAVSPDSATHFKVTVVGKRNGNHDSYATCIIEADRGKNGPSNQSKGTDAVTVTTWGTENSLAGTTFDLHFNGSSTTNVVRVLNPPAYQVDWSVTVDTWERAS